MKSLPGLSPSIFRRPTLFHWMILTGVFTLGVFVWTQIQFSIFRSSCDRLVIERKTVLLTTPTIEEEEIERYEFPHFDHDWWRDVLRDSSVKHRESKVNSVGPTRLVSFKGPVQPERYNFWSFQSLVTPVVPQVNDRRWGNNPVDRFILSRLEEADLRPSPPSSRRILGRRIWFDLTGLPPSIDQLEKFVTDEDPFAFEDLVDELLNEPSFGERWASVWLDLARYADSNGYEEDEIKPYAFTYRDFVIWAMNEDLGFDEFIRWQIAGDLLQPNNPLAVAATGFFTNAPLNTFLPQESERFDELDDQVGTMGRAMMGLTISCARCHDHFYDPISHEEYHRLVAVFKDTKREHKFLVPDAGSEYLVVGGPATKCEQEIAQIQLAALKEENIAELDYTDEQKDLLRQPIDPDNKEQALLLSNCMRCLMVEERQLAEDAQPLEKDIDRYNELVTELEQHYESLLPMPPMGLTLGGNEISKMPILKNGDSSRKGKLVGPGFLGALTSGYPDFDDNLWENWCDDDPSRGPSPRVALARWMTDTETGAGALVARVIVNRLWQHHFGEGLVQTPSNFGFEGSLPTHPELLEWLANELVQNDWSLKHIHRLILTSTTYQQSTRASKVALEMDPDNSLLSHQNLNRLTAEMIRDSMLVASGSLNRQMYGRPTFPSIPRQAIFNTQNSVEYTWPLEGQEPESQNRRSVYLVVKRTIPVPIMNLFDAPDGNFSCETRSETTVPTQALAFMNASVPRKQSFLLAEKLLETDWVKQEQLVKRAFLSILCRQPTDEELKRSLRFLSGFSQSSAQIDRLAEFCHVLFMTNEFIYLN